MNPTYIVSIVSFAFCLFIFFYFKWYIKRHTSAEELLKEYRTEVYRLIAEIDAVTDRDSQLVEERNKKLNSILDETDKRINVYVRELERSKTGEALYTSLGRGIRAALKSPAESAPAAEVDKAAQSSLLAQIAQGASAQPAKPPKLSIVKPPVKQLTLEETGKAAHEAAADSEASAPKNTTKKQLRSEIEKLVKQGVSASDIASRLDISLSEVDLAVSLLNRHKK